MRISEIYSSRQGEGRLTGQQSTFVRTSGCNLRCSFCDSPFTSWEPEGTEMAIETVLEQVERCADLHVVITGGEPMLPRNICELTNRIRETGRHITIETAGTIFRPVECDLMSISPKLSNSVPTVERAGEWSRKHEQARLRLDVLQRMIDQYDYQLKFVVQSEDDIVEIESLLDSLNAVQRSKVLLMPEGVDAETLEKRSSWIETACEERGFQFCPRMHIQWYGNERGT